MLLQYHPKKTAIKSLENHALKCEHSLRWLCSRNHATLCILFTIEMYIVKSEVEMAVTEVPKLPVEQMT